MERVLIIDDDRFTQNVLQKSLFKFYETRTADNGAVGLNLAQSWRPDAILLDVEMPGQNGRDEIAWPHSALRFPQHACRASTM